MADAQDWAESLDDDEVVDEFPTGNQSSLDDERPLDLMQPDQGMAPDTEAAEIATAIEGGDITRDTASEMEGEVPAELAAMHIVDEGDLPY